MGMLLQQIIMASMTDTINVLLQEHVNVIV